MEKAWQQLASKRKLTPTKAHGTIAVRWDLDNFFSYISTKLVCSTKLFFPNLYMFLFFGVTAFHVVHAHGCKPQSRLRTTWQKRAQLGTYGLSILPSAKRVIVMY